MIDAVNQIRMPTISGPGRTRADAGVMVDAIMVAGWFDSAFVTRTPDGSG